MRSVFVVSVTVDTDDLDPTELCEDVEDACAFGVDNHCDWAHEVTRCEALDVYPAGREVRTVHVQGQLL